jgi:hypothetical protein
MQQRPQDAAHMRVVVADEKPELVEIDAEHETDPTEGQTRLEARYTPH